MGTVATGVQKVERESFAPSSTFLEVVEYDPKENTLDITFRNGSKIRYLQVYPSTYLAFKQSPTHSAYYARAIKGNLTSVKLIDNTIGRNTSTPLKKVHDRRTLDAGLRKQESRNQRINGTVARAFAG